MMKYKLVCFDLDGTLVDDTIFVWQTLHDFFETDKELRRKVMDKYFSKEITYKEWAEHDVNEFRKAGATIDKIKEALSGLKLMEGAREVLDALKEKGVKLVLISGSVSIVLDMVFPDHPFDDVLINELKFDDSGLVSGCNVTKFDDEHKATGLRMIAEREGIDLSECVFVGDNHNDVHIAEIAGLSIAFNSKSDQLSQIADVVIPNGVKDVRAVLPYILEDA